MSTKKNWDIAVEAAKLAPSTGQVVLDAATVLEIASQLNKLRAPAIDERAAFEAHARRNGYPLNGHGGFYGNIRTRNQWMGWQARAALASAPVAGEAQPSRQVLLDAIHRYGNARAMAEHNLSYRDEVCNTADAMIALFDAAPQASSPVTGEALGWRVRERRGRDGELLDCFVEAPAAPGMAYAQEVLGDDYAEAQGGIEGKLKHCQMIVAWANATPQASAAGGSFQERVQPWMMECFGPVIAADRTERNHRFVEEALELAQACGCSSNEAHQLVDYVFGRPIGEPSQEVGGVMVTLAALCLANKLNMHDAADIELARISQPAIMAKIRAKNASKPKHSPLPGKYMEEQPDGTILPVDPEDLQMKPIKGEPLSDK